MGQEQDFERAWLAKLHAALDQVAGTEVRRQVMQGSDGLNARSRPQEVIAWSRQAMARLDSLVDEQGRRAIMTRCACQYPRAGLREVREAYRASGDADLAHRLLEERFESFLRDSLGLDEGLVQEIVGRGWGLAGVKQGSTIIATKIPKSGNLLAYMQETDPDRKRQLYCHCPRIREVLQSHETISPTYCYCGAGYYKGIWQEILGRPVVVEVLETVLGGGEVSRVAIRL